jgi:hypothetical protein
MLTELLEPSRGQCASLAKRIILLMVSPGVLVLMPLRAAYVARRMVWSVLLTGAAGAVSKTTLPVLPQFSAARILTGFLGVSGFAMLAFATSQMEH